jgi:hypothetical protein
MPPLRVYLATHCQGCERSLHLIAAVRTKRPAYPIEVIDLDQPDAHKPEAVFGTPTYMLGERIVFLGNPSLAALLALLDATVSVS